MVKELKNMMGAQAIVGGVDLDTATPNYTMLVADIPKIGMKLQGSKCEILQRKDGSAFIKEGVAWQTSTIQQIKLLDIADNKSLAHYRVATRNSVIQVIVNLKL